MFTPEELKALEEAGTQTAEITEFVPIERSTRCTSTRRTTSRPTRAAPSRTRCSRGAARIEALRARPLGGARQAVHRDDPAGRRTGWSCSSCSTPARCARSRTSTSRRPRCKDAELKLAQQLIEQQASDDVRSERRTRTRCARASRRRCRRRSRARRSRWPRRREPAAPGHRPHGSAAREPREEAGAQSASRAEPAAARKPPKRAPRREDAPRKKVAVHRQVVHPYGVRDVEKLLRLPRSTIRALVDAGFVSPGARAAQRAGGSRSRT